MFCVVFVAVIFSITSIICRGDTVETASGKIEGIEFTSPNGKFGTAYLGIPFAKAPVGDFRFKAPEPIPPWDDVLKANRKPNSCIQGIQKRFISAPYFDWFIDHKNQQSEDCLYLNIWKPNSRLVDATVMVWIHGGAFAAGSTAIDMYDGQILSTEEQIIVISINYRVSVFGFLALNSTVAPGNMGVMDQIMALKWIKENIDCFGGDPKKVTLFGQSAGAFFIQYHLTIPASYGLFQKAILMSGSLLANILENTGLTAFDASRKLIQALSCEENNLICNTQEMNDVEKLLQSKNTSEIIRVFHEIVPNDILIFRPVVDGVLIPEDLRNLLKAGKWNHNIDIMTGYAENEGVFITGLFSIPTAGNLDTFTDQQFLAIIQNITGIKNKETAEMIKHFYNGFENKYSTNGVGHGASSYLSDYSFNCGIHSFINYASDNGNKMYCYVYRHVPSTRSELAWTGATHGDDLDFVFGKPLRSGQLYSNEEQMFSRTVMGIYASFAKFGEPRLSHNDILDWPSYTSKNRKFLSIDLNMEVIDEPRVQQCQFWSDIYPKLEKQL